MNFKIAIIDDDLNNSVNEDDLHRVDKDNILEALKDSTSPEYEELSNNLSDLSLSFNNIEGLVKYINDESVCLKLPLYLQKLKVEALSRRHALIGPVRKVIEWLCEGEYGLEPKDIKEFHNTQDFLLSIESECYDLILVDYLLVDDNQELTIPFLKEIKERLDKKSCFCSFILMSSYSKQLSDDFLEIKSRVEMTSSRFRILSKPNLTDLNEEIIWKTTFQQIFKQKLFIQPIENFLHEWINNFNNATHNLSRTLWTLDAHTLDIIYRTSKSDNLSFYEYFSDVIFKKISSEFESSLNPHNSKVREFGDVLIDALESNDKITPGNEVADSRLFLKNLFKDVNWHQEHWFKPSEPFPIEDNVSLISDHAFPYLHFLRFSWLKRNLRFGTVLKRKDSEQFLVNLTQPCDIAHLTLSKSLDVHLLFICGSVVHMSQYDVNDKQALSSSLYYQDEWKNIYWNLSKPLTPPICEFKELLSDYVIVAQLRNEQAQYILNRYVTKISRVAQIKTPFLYELKYVNVALDTNKNIIIKKTGSCHALEENKKLVINFDPENAKIIVKELSLNSNILESLISGISLPKSNKVRLFSGLKNEHMIFLKNAFSEESVIEIISDEYREKLDKVPEGIIFIYPE